MIIDPILKLMDDQGAQSLVLRSGAPPVLDRRGQRAALSMPNLDHETVEMILEEITTSDQRADLATLVVPLELPYRTLDGREYQVAIQRSGESLRMSFRRDAAPGRPAPRDTTAPAATGTARIHGTPSANPAATPDGLRPTGPLHRPTVANDGAPPVDAPEPHAPHPSSHAPNPMGAAGESGASLESGRPSRAFPRLAPLADPFARPSSPRPSEEAGDNAVGRALDLAEHENASDVFVSNDRPIWVRVGGFMRALDETPDPDSLRAFFAPLLGAVHQSELETHGSCDLSFTREGPGARRRWRVNLFRRQGGISAVLRPIHNQAPSLRDLQLPDDFHDLAKFKSGLVLVTGTAGSGKSTTLIALVEHLNRTAAKHIVTLEDPIEHEYVCARALVQQREIGRDVSDFATGLRAALRESPDVILVGELRDHETIAAALTAAETGHLVLATLHAGSAAMAVDRIVDVFPEHQQSQVRNQLAMVLRAVVTQVLLPSTKPPARVPAYEKLLVTPAVATKIRDVRGHQLQSEIQKGRADGMVSLELSLARLVRSGRLTPELAAGYATDRQLLAELIRQA